MLRRKVYANPLTSRQKRLNKTVIIISAANKSLKSSWFTISLWHVVNFTLFKHNFNTNVTNIICIYKHPAIQLTIVCPFGGGEMLGKRLTRSRHDSIVHPQIFQKFSSKSNCRFQINVGTYFQVYLVFPVIQNFRGAWENVQC